MKIIEKVAILLGILGFIGTLVSWKIDNITAFTVTIGLFALSIFTYLVLFIIQKLSELRKDLALIRDVSNNFEKIENSVVLLQNQISDQQNQLEGLEIMVTNFRSTTHFSAAVEETRVTPADGIELLKPISEELWISSDRSNRQSIDSAFLGWDQCSILLWVYVPGKGEGLRNAPENRYLIAHQTGEEENSRHLNAFFLRYSSNNTWDMVFSNSKGERSPDSKQFEMDNGLEEGWHHLHIAWNHSMPIFALLIDSGDRIRVISKSQLSYWPREFDDSVFIGAWVSPYSGSYCDTKISHLWICRSYLEPSDPIVQEHLILRDF